MPLTGVETGSRVAVDVDDEAAVELAGRPKTGGGALAERVEDAAAEAGVGVAWPDWEASNRSSVGVGRGSTLAA